MLSAAEQQYAEQQTLVALAVAEAERLSARGSVTLAELVQVYQAAAVELAQQWMGAILAEQDIPSAPVASLVMPSFLTELREMERMFEAATTDAAMLRLTETLVVDAGRTARAVDMAIEPEVTSYIRSLTPPSCGRCVVLAGRLYRYSEGFQRHPKCDCLMTPTNHTIGPRLVTDQQEAVDNGWVSGLSKGDTEALQAGADLGQVVNVRRREAGLVIGSSVMERGGNRLTPQGCLHFASDRADQIRLLRKHGYIN